ncbi:MAG TPA: AAA family ATPase [Candidatus Acidoferrales bacterium]|nr:AAA family ATPase [Candidatus Acidoferrales bacterium]
MKTIHDAPSRPRLIIFGGLPGTGKTSLARELARELGAVYLRIDSIEQAILNSSGTGDDVGESGYRAAYAVAEDNLRLGRTVVADSVNPLPITREAWLGVGQRADAASIEIEVRCSDAEEHRQRVEARAPDIPGHRLPTWQEVVSHDYHPWQREHIIIDRSGRDFSESLAELRRTLESIVPPFRRS